MLIICIIILSAGIALSLCASAGWLAITATAVTTLVSYHMVATLGYLAKTLNFRKTLYGGKKTPTSLNAGIVVCGIVAVVLFGGTAFLWGRLELIGLVPSWVVITVGIIYSLLLILALCGGLSENEKRKIASGFMQETLLETKRFKK